MIDGRGCSPRIASLERAQVGCGEGEAQLGQAELEREEKEKQALPEKKISREKGKEKGIGRKSKKNIKIY